MIRPVHDRPLLPGTLENLFYPPRRGEYVYFERAAEVPFVAAGAAGRPDELGLRDVAKAGWAADASMLAYARFGEVRMTDAELRESFGRGGLEVTTIGENDADWNAPGTQAVFAAGAEFAVLAFRGTERDDPKDVEADADIVLRPEPNYWLNEKEAAPLLGPLSFVTQHFELPCLVHSGFQGALNRVWAKVHAAVVGYRAAHAGAEICFTGHSLGAALAVLAFSRFKDADMSLYTFGCPRVGDGAFRDRVLANAGRGIFRYVNFNDVVTHVPLGSLLYCQIPDACHRFDQDGDLGDDDGSFKGDVAALRTAVVGLPACVAPGDLDTVLAPPGLVDHSPARYCVRLWNCVP